MFRFINRPPALILETMRLSKTFVLVMALLALVERSPSQDFTAITTGALVDDAGAARGVSWIDFNNDGLLDLFVTRGPRQGQTALLFRNDGGPNFAFTKITGSPLVSDVVRSDGSSWGDYDNDGDPDAYVVTWYGDRNLFYENNGNGTFTKITASAIVNDNDFSETSAWGDYDNDGDLDLFAGNWGNQNNFLYRNDGGGILTKIIDGVLVNDRSYSACSGWGDYDNDGDLDLYVTQAYGRGSLKNFLYRNLLMESGAPAFEKMTVGPAVNDLRYSYGFSWADFDQDGDLDLFVARTLNENQKNAGREITFDKENQHATQTPALPDGKVVCCGFAVPCNENRPCDSTNCQPQDLAQSRGSVV